MALAIREVGQHRLVRLNAEQRLKSREVVVSNVMLPDQQQRDVAPAAVSVNALISVLLASHAWVRLWKVMAARVPKTTVDLYECVTNPKVEDGVLAEWGLFDVWDFVVGQPISNGKFNFSLIMHGPRAHKAACSCGLSGAGLRRSIDYFSNTSTRAKTSAVASSREILLSAVLALCGRVTASVVAHQLRIASDATGATALPRINPVNFVWLVRATTSLTVSDRVLRRLAMATLEAMLRSTLAVSCRVVDWFAATTRAERASLRLHLDLLYRAAIAPDAPTSRGFCVFILPQSGGHRFAVHA